MAETGGADCVRVLLAAQAEITLTITATYATYILADVYLKVSAVLACVALGTFLAAKGKHLISRDVQHPFHVVWWVLSSPGAGTLSTWCGGFYLALVQAPLPRHVDGQAALPVCAVPKFYPLNPGASPSHMRAPGEGDYQSGLRIPSVLHSSVSLSIHLSVHHRVRRCQGAAGVHRQHRDLCADGRHCGRAHLLLRAQRRQHHPGA
jgi:hypothetical protein